MARAVDVLTVVLLCLATLAFALGLHALDEHEDLYALYCLMLGSGCLKGSVDLLRPGISP